MTEARILVQGPYGGRIEQTGPHTLAARYPHQFITVLLLLPGMLMTVGVVLMVVGAILDGSIALFVPALSATAFGAGLLSIARSRSRCMGDFELDGSTGVLRRIGWRHVETWRREEIREARAQWDPFHRGFGRVFWVVVEVTDGRRLRLGKGSAEELRAALDLLGAWGVAVKPPQ